MSTAPEINRRRLLLGLAAASTAAATVSATAATAAKENPELLALFAGLAPLAEAYHAAKATNDEVFTRWQRATPWAPDELTELGIAWPNDDVKQPGEPEMKVLGGFLWRKGDDHPRRIVVKSWRVYLDLSHARRQLRKAKKGGSTADCLLLEEEVTRLKRLEKTASDYEKRFKETAKLAKAEHSQTQPVKDAAHVALEKHVALIMDAQDWTMEGLILKAQALAEWDRVGTGWFDRVAFQHGQNWHGQIAASILRHAQGGAS